MSHRASLAASWLQVAILAAVILGFVAHPVRAAVWPIPALIALALSALAGLLGPLRGSVDWYRPGRVGGIEVALGSATAVVAGAALIAWFRLARPDLSDLLAVLPRLHPLLMIGFGLGFATINAFAEEAIFRGALQGALERLLGAGVAPVLIQAALFGLAHIHGFPRGLVGVGLAATYGLVLGGIRWRSGGLLACWATHVVADLVIFGILAYAA